MSADWSVAVSGHTPFVLGGYTDETAQRLFELARWWLDEKRPREIVSGLAAGWDLAVAKAAVATGVPLVAALAYRGQADAWPADAAQEFRDIVSAAAEVYVYNETKAHGCYARRDRWVLERGTVVLALWSGIDGGTARALATAAKMDRPVFNVWEHWIASGGTFTPPT
jgi:predicted Rossmann fold nucleotide-binding protein DprA/Smf involved in DNA uptake